MNSTAPSGAYSGKRLTVVLLLVLLSTGGLFYWVTTAYGSYNATRRQTDRDWRELASALELRYQAFDKRVATGVSDQTVDPKLAEQWRAARDAFVGTGIVSLQVDAARQVEQLIDQLPGPLQQEPVSDDLSSALAQYQQSSVHQREVGSSLGSKVLKLLLNLPDPHEFSLTKD